MTPLIFDGIRKLEYMAARPWTLGFVITKPEYIAHASPELHAGRAEVQDIKRFR